MSAQPKIEMPIAFEKKINWVPVSETIVIGKDVLELVSSSMYVDPMAIYREYIQNAVDSIEESANKENGRVEIAIDVAARSIRIRDNGGGVPAEEFVKRLTSVGASTKRGTTARGFRGVGRLAGLGYCQELIFRTRSSAESMVSEMRWDCRELRTLLRSAQQDKGIAEVIREIVQLRKFKDASAPASFFEVELKSVARLGNDKLMNADAVIHYLAQVAPVPFSPEFKFAKRITEALTSHGINSALDIRVNGAESPLYRPYTNSINLDERHKARISDLEIHEIPGTDGSVAAIAWIAHHDYAGAIPSSALVKGIRARAGNIQVGEHSLFEELFPEQRFNSWSIGEVNILDRRLIPNGRRDHFEQSVHFSNLTNHLSPIAKDIARRCRQSSLTRKWLRAFELHKGVALDRAKAVARGGVSKATRASNADAARKSLKAMHNAVNQKYLSDESKNRLATEAKSVDTRVNKLIANAGTAADPLKDFKPQVRNAYEEVITLIYECVKNRNAAAIIVEKILEKIKSGKSTTSGPQQKR